MNPPIKRRYGLLNELVDRLERIGTTERILAYFLRRAVNFFDGDSGALFLHDRATDRIRVEAAIGPRDLCDEATVRRFLRNERPELPPFVAMAPLLRDRRAWGVLAVRRKGNPFQGSESRFLCKIASIASREVLRRESGRLRDVRGRVERKLLEDLRPEDVVYRILHGLRTLLHYDHSSAVLLLEKERSSFVLKAEQIAWKKGKSSRIGLAVEATPDAVRALSREGAAFLVRPGGEFAGDAGLAAIASAVRFATREAGEPEEGVILAAPLAFRGEPVGILKVSARIESAFDAGDLEVVRAFAEPAAAALRRSAARERLESSAARAEKKAALADLARAVAHDVNNALGVAMPLLQQIAFETRSGRTPDLETLDEDLRLVVDSLHIVKRVFSGMMAFARGPRSLGTVDVGRSVADTLALLQAGVARNGLRLEAAIAEGLPPVRGHASLLEQVLLNLVSNAREATPPGGAIRVEAALAHGRVTVLVADSGPGMDAAVLERVREPFFTTKPDGTGLGLAICRAIVEEMGGAMTLESSPGAGTRVAVSLPPAEGAPAAAPSAGAATGGRP